MKTTSFVILWRWIKRRAGSCLEEDFTTRENLFITGRAGSGKSTFMRRIVKFLGKCVIVAPTGVAALNAGGQTIHSFFSIKNDPYIPSIERGMLSNKVDVSPFMKKKIKNLDTIVIDEISMVRPDLLDEVADILRQCRRSKEPFGGVRLIMFGDLSQLPPVVTADDLSTNIMRAGSFLIKGIKSFRILGHYLRERIPSKDPQLLSVLEDIRCGVITDESRQILDSRVKYPDNMDNTIIICSTNKEAYEINKTNLDKINNKVFKFDATVFGEKPVAPCEDELIVKVGAKVIITRNGNGYVNGSMGIITSIDTVDETIYVHLDNDTEVEITKEKWEKMKYKQVDDSLEGISCGYIIQYPLRLGYAITVHKSQGMTLDNIFVDISRAFEIGQIYTALSRCRSIDGLYLKSVPKEDMVLLSDKISDFMDKVDENEGVLNPERYLISGRI